MKIRLGNLVVWVAVLSVILSLNPDAARVQAFALFGGLRSAGEGAFVASHRGDRTSAPENTLAAFQAAMDASSRFVETDVRLTKDGVPILMHDQWVDRTTNGTGKVTDLTLAEIETLDAGAWFSPRFAGTKVPTLESLLALLKERSANSKPTMALVELKGFWSVDEAKIVTDLIESFDLSERVVLMSFDMVSLNNAMIANDAIPRAILTRTLPKDPVAFAGLYGAIAIATSASEIEHHTWLVDRLHRAGIAVLVYTLNSKSSWDQAVSLGVDGIITDKPKPLKRWIASLEGGS